MQFSFIIPAYNTASYIERCLDSIAIQAIDEYEIIVIDDGSTDETARIVAARANNDRRIRLISQDNSGQGAARNVGVDAARGDYLWFVDSDDWLLPGAGGRISEIIQKRAPDVVLLNFVYADEDGLLHANGNTPLHLLGREVCPTESADTFSAVSCWNTPPWRLLTARRLVQKGAIKFAEGVFYEDHPFAIEVAFSASSVFVDAPATYAYFQRADSTTHVNDRRCLDFLTIRNQCIEIFKKNGRLEEFRNISASYISPVSFFEAHVPSEMQAEFIERLKGTFTQDDMDLLAMVPDPNLTVFANSANKGIVPYSVPRSRSVLKRLLTREGRSRAVSRVRSKLRSLARRAVYPGEVASTANGFMQLGLGSVSEHTRIDVRMRKEDRPYVVVGQNSLVGGTYVFERGLGAVKIGDKSSIGHGTTFICTQDEGITVGDNVLISWDVTIIDSNSHSLDPEIRAEDAFNWKLAAGTDRMGAYKDWEHVESAPIVIEDGSWIGFGASIMKGVTIGKGSVVASCAVVTRDVAPYTIVAGNPARFVKFVPRKRWAWEDILAAAHGSPEFAGMLEEAYLHKDSARMLKRYRESEEFRDTALLAREFVANPRTVLDVGAGNGVCSLAFALEGYNVVAVEPEAGSIGGAAAFARMVSAAEEINDDIRSFIDFQPMGIEKYETSQQFDVAICRQVVHHFPDPVVALRKIYEQLKPGGVVICLREHVIFDEEDKQAFLEWHPFHKFYKGENAYKIEEYVSFIEQAGFTHERTLRFQDSPINFFPHSFALAAATPEISIPGRPYTFVGTKPVNL